MKHKEFLEYKILSFQPVSGINAIYADVVNIERGDYKLYEERVLFIALVECQTMRVEVDSNGFSGGKAAKLVQSHKAIMGIDLTEGQFGLCDRMTNFAGYTTPGENFEDFKPLSNVHEYRNLIKDDDEDK